MKLSNRIVLFNDGDLKGDVDSAAKNIQTIYIQAVSGTLSVNAPNTWVGVSDESVSGTPPNATAGQTPHWTTKKPTYQSNYPIIFVAEQRRGVNNAITCSTPVKDDTTTIIDGGHITTGTIDASVVNVTNINANNINSGKVKAEYVETNRITIGQTQVSGLGDALAVAANTALYYITEDETDGIKIHDTRNVNTNYAQIKSDGMYIYKGGNSVASFGTDVRLGEETGKHVLIDEDSVDIKDGTDVKATFGETVTIGDENAYHTSITETDFGICSGNDSMFNVSATGEQKSIIAKAFDLPAYINHQSSTRNTSGSMKAGTTYTFYLYKTTGQVGTYTFNTDDVTWSSSPISRSFGYLNNTVNIVVWKPVNGSAHYMARQETSVDPRMMYRFYAEYPTTIDIPTMEFQGPVTIEGHDSPIGTILSGSGSKSTTKTTTLGRLSDDITLSAGTWVMVGNVGYHGNSDTTYRAVAWHAVSNLSVSIVNTAAINSSSITTRLQTTIVLSVEEDTTYCLYGAQNGKDGLTADYYWRAIRIA